MSILGRRLYYSINDSIDVSDASPFYQAVYNDRNGNMLNGRVAHNCMIGIANSYFPVSINDLVEGCYFPTSTGSTEIYIGNSSGILYHYHSPWHNVCWVGFTNFHIIGFAAEDLNASLHGLADTIYIHSPTHQYTWEYGCNRTAYNTQLTPTIAMNPSFGVQILMSSSTAYSNPDSRYYVALCQGNYTQSDYSLANTNPMLFALSLGHLPNRNNANMNIVPYYAGIPDAYNLPSANIICNTSWQYSLWGTQQVFQFTASCYGNSTDEYYGIYQTNPTPNISPTQSDVSAFLESILSLSFRASYGSTNLILPIKNLSGGDFNVVYSLDTGINRGAGLQRFGEAVFDVSSMPMTRGADNMGILQWEGLGYSAIMGMYIKIVNGKRCVYYTEQGTNKLTFKVI